jgi:hypothetical protein
MSERIYTAADNDGKSIFVFGSNSAGRHGAGAAREALKNWGAIYGQGEGRQGMAYGICTKDHNIQTRSLESIDISVLGFIEYAKAHPELGFLVTKIGTGLAGLSESDIAPMFLSAPDNCILPEGWRK